MKIGISKGMGDTIKKILSFLGFKACDACEERRKKLNKALPYKE